MSKMKNLIFCLKPFRAVVNKLILIIGIEMNKKFYTHSESPKKNTYIFQIAQARHITISSNFQSGNIRLIRQVNSCSYVLESVSDVEGTIGKKSWFYFKMKAWNGVKIKVKIENVNIYQNCLNSQQDYHPLYKVGTAGDWEPLLSSTLSNDQTVTLIFEYKFTNLHEVFFCLTVPFTYTDNQIYLSQLETKILSQISYKNQLLAFTPQNRQVRLLTITEYDSNNHVKQSTYKPVILITSRVHPGEVSSSFCMMGIIQMLISQSLQGYLLRRFFQWKIVPMVNPDGVACGNYRMDPNGGNLNRHYQDPNEILQPAVFHILHLIKTLSTHPKKIEFYFDLHSHSAMKESFIYGNAFDDLIEQAYSQLFCRLLEENCLWFKYNLCQFGEKHMKFKDKGEEKTKEGCGRVMAYKIGKVIKSYTLEISILPAFFFKKEKLSLKEPKNPDFQCSLGNYKNPLKLQVEATVKNPLIAVSSQLGKDLLVSILDMIQKNPYSRVDKEFSMNCLRQSSQRILQKQERFKLFDTHNYSKAKMAVKIVQETFQKELDNIWIKSGIAHHFNSISWPSQVKKIREPEVTKLKLKTRLETLRSQIDQKDEFRERKRRIKTDTRQQDDQILEAKLLERQATSLPNTKKDIGIEKKKMKISFKIRDKLQRKDDLSKIFESVPSFLFQNSFRNNHINEAPTKNALFDKYVIHNITPSMCLFNSAKSIARERSIKRTEKRGNINKSSAFNHKRALTDLKLKMDSFNDCSLSQGKISLEFSVEINGENQRINELRKRLGKDTIDEKKQLEKERIKLPSLKRNKLQPIKGRAE